MTQSRGVLPAELPFLPLYNQVLLPGAFARVHFKRSGPVSGPLLQHLLAQQGEQVLVAAVPVLETDHDHKAELQQQPEDASSDCYKQVATAARVLQVSRNTQTGASIVTLEGWCRIFTDNAPRTGPSNFLVVSVEPGEPSTDKRLQDADSDKEMQKLAAALQTGTKRLAGFVQPAASAGTVRLAELLQKMPPPAAADVLASMLTSDTAFKQLVLEAVDPVERLRIVVGLLQQFIDKMKADGVPGSEESNGKQLAIRPPTPFVPPMPLSSPFLPGMAGRGAFQNIVKNPEDEDEEDLSALMKRLRAAKPPAEVLKVANREHRKLKKSNEHHPGYAMSRAYLETLADLPWNTFSGQAASKTKGVSQLKDASSEAASDADSTITNASTEQTAPEASPTAHPITKSPAQTSARPAQSPTQSAAKPAQAVQLSLAEARRLLDKDHYGLDKVKDRIIQYLAVRKLKGPDARAPILCFVGPPGTGKTSLASSISKVLLRPFQRVSVGGVRDEAEIRGHRRTYVGAMPGRIIQALRRSGVRDPVLLLDEVDKMGHDSLRGDPASALLEVLDPNQNQAFVDTYLSLPFDLSQVVFVATANQLQNMSGPLLDRLEIIQLSGYTLDEKRHIAQRHLIPGVLAEHGLRPQQLHFPDDAITLIADGYTREAGVRSLSRNLAAICRHVAVQIVSEQDSRQPAIRQSSDISEDQPEAIEAHQQPALQPVIRSHPQIQHDSQQLTADQQHEQQTESGISAVEQGVQLPAAGFSLGSLWGSLKGALKPPVHLSPNRRRHHSDHTAHHTGHHTGYHNSPRRGHHSGNEKGAHTGRHEALASQVAGQKGFQRVESPFSHDAPPQGLHSLLQPSEQISASGAVEVPEDQDAVSNPFGGVNADMASLTPHQLPTLTVTSELITEVLGPRKHNETDSADSLVMPGSAAGLVWTAVGGQVQYVECCCTSLGQPQRPGKLVLTGQAGEVLQESARLALSWIRSHTHQLAAAAAAAHPDHPVAAPQSNLQQSSDTRSGAVHESHVSSCCCSDQCQAPHKAPRYYSHTDVAASSCRQPAHQLAAPLSTSDEGLSTGTAEQCNCHPHFQEPAAEDSGAAQQREPCHLQESLSPASSVQHREAGALQEADNNCTGAADVARAAAQWDLHVHLPAGAVSKDGPSAGITLATAMVSLFLGRCARADTAMTGELTLRGLVLPIGGLKEKLLAAHHAGIKRVLVPKRNWRDVQADVPKNIKDNNQIIPVHVLEDVLQHAFDPPLIIASTAKL